MGRSVSFLVLAAFLSMDLATLEARQQRIADAAAPNPLIQQMLSQVSKSNVLLNIQKLQAFGTRYEMSLQRDSAATLIINLAKSYGYSPESDNFSYSLADYQALDVVNQNTVWIVGQDTRNQQNFLLRTTDGGSTWVFQPPPKAINLSAIDFVNAQTGWIVGSGGGIFKSTDGGNTWQTQVTGMTASFFDVGFANDQAGLAVGEGGTLLRTSDGGANWSSMNSGVSTDLRKCKVLNASQMWIVGNAGTILHSNDGGVTWLKQNSGVTNNLESVDFVDSLRGWAIGSLASLVKTTDGGRTWRTVAMPADVRRDVDTKQEDLCVIDSLNVLVLSVSEIWKTSDGGISWKRMANVESHSLKAMSGQSILTFGGLAGVYRTRRRCELANLGPKCHENPLRHLAQLHRDDTGFDYSRERVCHRCTL